MKKQKSSVMSWKEMTGYFDSIKFTHSNGIEYTFRTEPNPMNDSQMWWFEPQVSMYAGTVRESKKIAKNIRKLKDK